MIHSVNSTRERSETAASTADPAPLRELVLLEVLAENPEAKQADLAARLGVAVGTINWLVKRLAAKGFVKVKRIGRWQWHYLVTPRGLARKAHLTQQYVHLSMELYRTTREQARLVLQQVKEARYASVCLDGDPTSDLTDVCRLTCLEQGIHVAGNETPELGSRVPRLRVSDGHVVLEWPKEASHG
jgi:DNA-binding MarR family transcriptional regulator